MAEYTIPALPSWYIKELFIDFVFLHFYNKTGLTDRPVGKFLTKAVQ